MSLFLTALLRIAEYAILSLGFSLIFSTTSIFHFAFGPIYAVAAYAALGVLRAFGLSFPLAALGGALLSVLLAVVIHVTSYEPLLRRPRPLLALLITSFGLFTILQAVITLPFGHELQALPAKLRRPTLMQVGSATVTSAQMIGFALEVATVVAVLILLRSTRFGLIIRAVGADSDLADTLGIDLRKVRTAVMALGTALSAVAALATTLSVGVLTTSMGMQVSLAAAVAVFVGGVGRPLGRWSARSCSEPHRSTWPA